MTVSAPGSSTSGVSMPGPSGQGRHQHITDKNRYHSGENFDYFVGGTGDNDSETDDDMDVNDNVNVDGIVQNEGNEAIDGLYYSESDDDDIDVVEDGDDENKGKKKRKRRNKWEERQDLKWEHLTKKFLYEAAKDDMANGVYKSYTKCAAHYDINDKTLGKLIRENREYVGDNKKSKARFKTFFSPGY